MISINISELIWTVINFFLLYFLLKRFLYTPVIRFMKERQSGIDAKLGSEREAREQVAENEKRLEAEKAKSRGEAKQLLDQTTAAMKEKHTAYVAQARSEAVQNRKSAEQALQERCRQTEETLHSAAPELASQLAERLLGEG